MMHTSRYAGISNDALRSRGPAATCPCASPLTLTLTLATAFVAVLLSIPILFSFIDCAATLQQLQEYAVAHNWHVPVMIKIDAGNKRAGVPDNDALDIARQASAFATGGGAGVQLMGIYSHSGHAYACQCLAEAQACAAEEFRRMGELCARLETAGVQVPFVSVGSVRQHVFKRALGGRSSGAKLPARFVCEAAPHAASHALFALDAGLLRRGGHEGRGAGLGYSPRSTHALVFYGEGVGGGA